MTSTSESKRFNVIFGILALCAFFIVALRSYLVPFNHDEVATFFFYIQSGHYMPFYSHVDANNHVLNSLLGNICFHLFGSSPFALRLPNLLGFIVLILSTYKLTLHLTNFSSKLFLVASLLLSFHWLTFFSACRGYGLSMALLVAALSFMLDYIKDVNKASRLYLCLLFLQLAISSNLILIIVNLLISAVLVLHQLLQKKLFTSVNVILWLTHFGLVVYWLKFSFFLKENGALYYGEGDSYWQVTFVTLIELIVGFYNPIVKWSVLLIILVFAVLGFWVNKQQLQNIKQLFFKPESSLLLGLMFTLLVIGFYLMNKLFGVNFPEDRTGLFFYVFLILYISFIIDKLPITLNKILSYSFASLFLLHFTLNINFRKFSMPEYETIPEHFYSTLMKEQEKSSEKITIGGHRLRELFWGFMNYRHGAILNPADPVELMQMNCDYYIGHKSDETYYKDYYDVIDSEPDWGFVVLKRKEKITRNLVVEKTNVPIETIDTEFIDCYNHGDTVFQNQNPLLAEFNFDINKISVPNNTWVVFSVCDSLEQTVYFKRFPLQWIGYDLNGKKNLTYSIVIGNLPKRSKKIVCFFWNIDKQPLSIMVKKLKIYQLEGRGVTFEAPEIKP